jgi:hypothetical protein
MELRPGRLDQILAAALQRQVECLAGLAFLRGRHVGGLARPVRVLRRDQVLGEQVPGPLEIALRQGSRRARAGKPHAELLDLLRAGAGEEVAELGVGRSHGRLGSVHVRPVLGVEAGDELPAVIVSPWSTSTDTTRPVILLLTLTTFFASTVPTPWIAGARSRVVTPATVTAGGRKGRPST